MSCLICIINSFNKSSANNVVFLTPIVLYLFSAWFGAKKNLELGIDLKLVFEDQSANPIKLTYFNESAK
jgi:hypothetical protein